MRRWLSVICLGVLSFYTYAEQKELSSSIKAVTVYADRAAINRKTQELSLPAGEHELYFKNLPAQLDNNSVQADVLSTAPATILDVTTKQQVVLNESNPRLQKLDETIKQLNDKKRELNYQKELLTNNQGFIKSVQEGVLAINKDGSRPTLQEVNSAMQFSKQKLLTLLERLHQVNNELNKIDKQLTALHNDYKARENNRAAKEVVIRVNLQQASKIKVDLSYVTSNARWYPRYDVRFNTQTDQLQLDYSGIVEQMTGEDWSNVKLTLSTAKPNLSSNIPTLNTWLIDQFRQREIQAEAVSYDLMEHKQVAAAPVSARALSKAKVDEVSALKPLASVDMGATSASFNIANSISLNSGRSEQRVSITVLNLPHKLNYITVPKLASAAYLQVEATNNSDYPLIGGKLNVFMDNRFVTSSHLKTTMPKETLKLDLGVDKGITVTYKPIKRFTEKTGFTNSYDKVTYEYLLTIQNNKKTPQTIKVLDQIPVSENEKITVKQLLPDPKVVKQNKAGEISWTLTLMPQEKQESAIQFSIEYPSGLKVIGVN